MFRRRPVIYIYIYIYYFFCFIFLFLKDFSILFLLPLSHPQGCLISTSAVDIDDASHTWRCFGFFVLFRVQSFFSRWHDFFFLFLFFCDTAKNSGTMVPAHLLHCSSMKYTFLTSFILCHITTLVSDDCCRRTFASPSSSNQVWSRTVGDTLVQYKLYILIKHVML